ncbi:hypothetical protein [Bradyrhizobium sp.]|uniref:hypothetical protein n=1 Tax=Bradyrhizobium sp. TaxID=376 RepID=UPI0025BFEAD5|nr:hypothetical protein [Bradyrhizobium sp.]
MPVARYFLVVGGVLLALLFVIDALMPRQVVASHAAPAAGKAVVRIQSDQKLPERVVYDTSLPTIVPPPAMLQAAAPPAAVEPAAQARVRDTFAQFVPSETRKLETKPVQRKRKIAISRSTPPMRIAQQSRFGLFGSGWN